MSEATLVICVQKCGRTASQFPVISVCRTELVFPPELYELLQEMKEVCLIYFKYSI